VAALSPAGALPDKISAEIRQLRGIATQIQGGAVPYQFRKRLGPGWCSSGGTN